MSFFTPALRITQNGNDLILTADIAVPSGHYITGEIKDEPPAGMMTIP